MTKLDDITDKELVRRRVMEGYIYERRHPALPLRILNYSPAATFDDVWDIATEICRGLIVDDDDVVIARPFKKFWGIGDPKHSGTHEANLSNGLPIVTGKLDGSLGVYWSYAGQEGIATRGSFTSEQAIWATRFLSYNYPNRFRVIAKDDFTPLFEIIFAANRIVVEYDYEGIVLLAIIENKTGAEVSYPDMKELAGFMDVPVVTKFDKSLSEVVAENTKNAEGYVLCYHGKVRSAPLRVKVKFADYMRLHKLITGVSVKSLWKMLADGNDPANSMGDGLPESFTDWVRSWTTKMLREYNRVYEASHKVYRDFVNAPREAPFTRKEAAEEFLKHPDVASICFSLLDVKAIVSRQIWNHVWQNMKSKVSEEDVFRQEVEDAG